MSLLVSIHHNKTKWPNVKKGHLLDVTRALFHKNVPKQYQGESVLTVAHLIN